MLALIMVSVLLTRAQHADPYPYYPGQVQQDDWKIRIELFGSQESNSNTFTNNFIRGVTGSGYLDPQLKNDQIEKMNGEILTGTLESIGGGIYFKTKKLIGYAGVDHQHILDSRIGSNLVKLLLLGNKPFAGNTLNTGPATYTNLYFNRLIGGVGYALEKEKATHLFFGKVALTGGQNYDRIRVEDASLYTHPDGDYLNMTVAANTQVSDTVWAGVFDINGIGMSVDLSYSMQKTKDYYIGMTVSNLGFVNWNGNTFSASVDTSFVFEGVSMDTTATSDGEVPDDYSYNSLRRILFKNPDGSPFSKGLPVILNLGGGKYFSDGKFYAGLNAFYYPGFEASYKVEVFGTWNCKSVFQLTPIITYGAYQQVHFGIAAAVKLADQFYLQAGSNYLNSYFIGDSPAGRGGFFRLVFVN